MGCEKCTDIKPGGMIFAIMEKKCFRCENCGAPKAEWTYLEDKKTEDVPRETANKEHNCNWPEEFCQKCSDESLARSLPGGSLPRVCEACKPEPGKKIYFNEWGKCPLCGKSLLDSNNHVAKEFILEVPDSTQAGKMDKHIFVTEKADIPKKEWHTFFKEVIDLVMQDYFNYCEREGKEPISEIPIKFNRYKPFSLNPKDNWNNRSQQMTCQTCMYFRNMRCRRHAPTMQGFPAVYPNDPGCGPHKLDKEAMKK